jgi:hypothetical protein
VSPQRTEKPGYGTVRFRAKERYLEARKKILTDHQPGHPNSSRQKEERMKHKLIEIIQEELDRIGMMAYAPTTRRRVEWQTLLIDELSWMTIILPELSTQEMFGQLCAWASAEPEVYATNSRNKKWLMNRVGRILDLCGIIKEADRASFYHFFYQDFAQHCRTLKTKVDMAKVDQKPMTHIDTVAPLEIQPQKQSTPEPEQYDLFTETVF